MLVLITYDVNTEDAAGRKRLRQIAKKCVDYGQRVQNSVFECLLDAGQCRRLQAQLLSIMDSEKDSLRFYYLGKQYEKKDFLWSGVIADMHIPDHRSHIRTGGSDQRPGGKAGQRSIRHIHL